MSGCLDSSIRLWSIPKKSVLMADKSHTNEAITALSFSPDAKWLVAGLATVGMCVLYENIENKHLKDFGRIDCRNRKGRHSSGRKVAGVSFISNEEFLVATNDSRLRLFSGGGRRARS